MDRADILAGSAFRAVLRSAVVFVLVLGVGALLTVRYNKSALMEQARERVIELHHGLEHLEDIQGEDQLIAIVDILATHAAGETLAYALYRKDGMRLAGNMDLFLAPGTWRESRLHIQDAHSDFGDYLLYSSLIRDHVFVSGRNLSFVETAATAMTRGFALAGFVVVIAMIGTGYVMSRHSQEKLENIERVLERVAEGEAGARIGVTESRDQIDRISQKIDAQLAKLDAVMQSTKRASAAVAHDLRKPLARAALILERGLARAEAGEDVRDTFEDSLLALDKLSSVIATILRIARIEGHDIGHFRRFDLRDVLDEVAESYDAVLEDAAMRLDYERPEEPVELIGDGDMIAQLIINLLQNAVTHAGAGATVSLFAERTGKEIRLGVADTGHGLPEDMYDKVFEPMYRADAARTKDGNGLGLALVKAIADRHGAQITLSDAKPGLRVITSFPAS